MKNRMSLGPLSPPPSPPTLSPKETCYLWVWSDQGVVYIYQNSCFILASFPGHSQILSVEKIWLIFFTAIYKLKSGPIFLHSCKLKSEPSFLHSCKLKSGPIFLHSCKIKSGSSLGTRLVYSLSETAQQHS